MKFGRFIAVPLALLFVSGAVWGADYVHQSDKKSSVDELNSSKESSDISVRRVTGIEPQVSEAEKVKKAEEAYQAQLAGVDRAVVGLEKQVSDLRKQANNPSRMEVERLDRNLALTEEELNRVSITNSFPLIQLQRSDMQDRMFEVRLAMEILKNRWGGGWRVFGMDFFGAAQPGQAPEQGRVPANYRIRVDDTLRIEVTSALGAQTEYTPVVDAMGRVHVPGAGSVLAKGKSAEQLGQYLTTKIGSRFRQLRVGVFVEKLSTIRVQVAGEVARPGTYSLTGIASVFNALNQAGGPTKAGTFRSISLMRTGESKRTIDLYGFLLSGDRKGDVPLEDGDLIFVPPVGKTIVMDGEVVRPGRYEPDFPLSLAAALKMAGGTQPGSYLQAVRVERVQNGEYKVLMSASLSSTNGKPDFAVEPGDQITISSVRTDKTNQVEIFGPVGSPGVYGYKDGMLAADLVKLAQGLARSKEVYGGRADILRIDPLKGTEIITFSLDRALSGDPAQNVALQKLDRVFLYEPDQVVFRPRLATVLGSVSKPGGYKRTEGMRVSDLMAAAGGVLPDAYVTRADLIRHTDDSTTELVRVDLAAAMAGDATANVRLQDRDELTVYSHQEAAWSEHNVRIEGAVQRPGVYQRSANMRVSDLIFACGGLMPEAAGIAEVGHSTGAGQSEVVKVSLDTLKSGDASDIELHDQDVVTVVSLNPSQRSPDVVYIMGEVANPGPYTLKSRDDKLTDLVARAGGLTAHADRGGTLFLRQKESFENSQQGKDVDIILRKSRAFADKQFMTALAKLGVALPGEYQASQRSVAVMEKPSEVVAEERLMKGEMPSESSQTAKRAGKDEQERLRQAARHDGAMDTGDEQSAESGLGGATERPKTSKVAKASAMGARVVEYDKQSMLGFEGRQELADLTKSARISVNLNRAFENPGSPDDLPMRNGDRVFIPRTTNVVTVIGAVMQPHAIAAGPGNNADYYIQMSGGYSQDASKGNVVVVRANGDALPKDRVASVEPGDMVVVPTTGIIDITKKWERAGSVTKVFTDILSSVYVLTRF